MRNHLMISFIIALSYFSFAQPIKMPYIEVEPIFKGALVFYKTIAINYTIKMSVSFPEDISANDTSYGIVCIQPDGEVIKMLFDVSGAKLLFPQKYEYSFSISTKQNGWLRVFMAERKDIDSDRGVDFYGNTSNKVNVYLDLR